MTEIELQKLNEKLRWLRLLRIEGKENPGDGIELIFGDKNECFKLSLAYGAGDVWHKLVDLGEGSSYLDGITHFCRCTGLNSCSICRAHSP